MKNNLFNELVIVCISALCIFIMSSFGKEENIVQNNNDELVDGVLMTSDGNEVGVLKDEEECNKTLDMIKTSYTNNMGVDDDYNIKIKNDIKYEEVMCRPNELLSDTEAANKVILYNDNNKESLISFIACKNINLESSYAIDTNSNENGELYKEVFLDGSLYTPIKGILTSTFGESRNGYFHKGIDLAADTGTNIGAAMDGVVSFAGVASGYGNVVIIDHGGNLQTVYAHCSELCTTTGSNVSKGENIAKVGSTGDSTGPHLHFEIRVNGTPVDPLGYSNKIYQY